MEQMISIKNLWENYLLTALESMPFVTLTKLINGISDIDEVVEKNFGEEEKSLYTEENSMKSFN